MVAWLWAVGVGGGLRWVAGSGGFWVVIKLLGVESCFFLWAPFW